MPLALAIKVVVRYLPPGSELEVIGLYLGSACVVIGIGLALYGGMRRCVPSFLSLITGGRFLITKMACLRNSLIRGFLLGMGAFR